LAKEIQLIVKIRELLDFERMITMNVWRGDFTRLVTAVVGMLALAAVSAAATLDRDYKMGDDSAEGAVTGGSVSVTFDSAGQTGQGQLVDLTAVNTPTYVAISGRPDGGGGRGIQFNAAQQEYLRGPRLGLPSTSFSSTAVSGTLDYTGISDRGLQFWVRPTSTAVQSLVMDTNQHGVRINSSGQFSMRYAGADFASAVNVVPNTWYHVEVVRPAGAANGSRMYVNGIAAAAAPGGYTGTDTSDLVVGSNTGGDDTNFTGGNSEFFSGIIDDLKLFVIGTSTSPTPVNYGGFNLATDNQFVASTVTGIKGVAGDVTNDGLLTQADKNAFIAGWMDRRIVNGFQIGDMLSRSQGDLNLDGITDIHDLVVFQGVLSGAGLGAITAAELRGVPEPSTAAMIMIAALGARFVGCWRRR
jgi:hypothetical protein